MRGKVGDLFAEDGDPVDGSDGRVRAEGCGKPLVALNILDPILQIPEALREVHLKEILEEVAQFGRKMGRKAHLSAYDLLVDLDRLVREEGRVPGRHLVDLQAHIDAYTQ